MDILPLFFRGLYSEHSRAKMSKTLVLAGLALVVLHILRTLTVISSTVMYIVSLSLVITLFILALYHLDKMSKNVSQSLLDSFLCIFGGVKDKCDKLLSWMPSSGVAGQSEDQVEKLMRFAFDVQLGGIDILGILLEEPKKLTKLLLEFLKLLIHELLIPLSMAILLAVILDMVDLFSASTKAPPGMFGILLIVLGFILGSSCKIPGIEGSIKEEGGGRVGAMISLEDILGKMFAARGSKLPFFIMRAIANANPNFLGIRLEMPLLEWSSYECSPRLKSDVVYRAKEILERHGYELSFMPDISALDEIARCGSDGEVPTPVRLSNKAPINIFYKCLPCLCGNECIDECGFPCIRIEIKERKSKSNEAHSVPPEASTVAVCAIGVLRENTEQGTNKTMSSKDVARYSARQILYVWLVGRRDVAGVIKMLMDTYLRSVS